MLKIIFLQSFLVFLFFFHFVSFGGFCSKASKGEGHLYTTIVKNKYMRKRDFIWTVIKNKRVNPKNIYLFKVRSRKNRKSCEICLRVIKTIKTPD